jgi:hypothetical protein
VKHAIQSELNFCLFKTDCPYKPRIFTVDFRSSTGPMSHR